MYHFKKVNIMITLKKCNVVLSGFTNYAVYRDRKLVASYYTDGTINFMPNATFSMQDINNIIDAVKTIDNEILP